MALREVAEWSNAPHSKFGCAHFAAKSGEQLGVGEDLSRYPDWTLQVANIPADATVHLLIPRHPGAFACYRFVTKNN